jgi:hypothetical protein
MKRFLLFLTVALAGLLIFTETADAQCAAAGFQSNVGFQTQSFGFQTAGVQTFAAPVPVVQSFAFATVPVVQPAFGFGFNSFNSGFGFNAFGVNRGFGFAFNRGFAGGFGGRGGAVNVNRNRFRFHR